MVNRSAKVAAVAGRQWGLVTWAQLAGRAFDRKTISDWVRRGYLHRVHPRVYAVGHRAGGFETALAAALLYAGPGAMLSHGTAIWWLGLIDKPPSTIHISTPRRCRSLRGIKLHQRRDSTRTWHKNLPVTTVAQTLLDFASRASLNRV